MKLMMIWHQYLDYRGLEGMARSLINMGIIPCYGDYTTVWHRIHDMEPDMEISGLEYAAIGTDGTGLKTNNAGSYRITKYGDPDAKRKKHLVVIITADVRTKKIIGMESHIEGNGPSEPDTAGKHMKEAVVKGVRVREFYWDGAFDVNDLFDLTHSIGAKPVIKIRKNAPHGSLQWKQVQAESHKIIPGEGIQDMGRRESLLHEVARNRGNILSGEEEIRGELCERVRLRP